ncbi:MAG: LysM peptidoglycan-binding domain-containing protein [Candidatus Binatia bacterium]|nr:LysM peptidoglycan-binding domain-containing protein [Candidatus Binatia bacterium]
MMRVRVVLVLSLLALLAGVSDAKEHGHDGMQGSRFPHYFPYPPALKPQVEFWKKIFAQYSEWQVVIHDTEDLDKVYTVLDFRPFLDETGLLDGMTIEQFKAAQTKRELERIRALLLRLHARGGDDSGLTHEEKKIWNLYKDVRDPEKFRKAAEEGRLRSQSGLRERFAEGIRLSRRYLHEMEEIFRKEGLPVELTRLPLIESCFNLRAYSKAGAAGIWQFIPATGRLYMRIDGAIDERRDPLISTRAAARLLKTNYAMLGTWPLAITAYNHGPYGVAKAVKTLGTTDIDKIIRLYRGERFGFASRNFYPEFLAALEVERDYQNYFGPLRLEPPLRYDEVRLEHYLSLQHVAYCANTSTDEILALNPALQEPIRTGRARIPRGYRVRVPAGTAPLFLQRYAALAPQYKAESQNAVFALHKVRPGQTLAHIARQHGTTTAALVRLNGLKSGGQIRVGQTLRVPVRTGSKTEGQLETAQQGSDQPVTLLQASAKTGGTDTTPGKKSIGTKRVVKKPAYVTHKVRQGQTLHQIARRYNTTPEVLRRLNGVSNVRRLQAGQILRVPTNRVIRDT